MAKKKNSLSLLGVTVLVVMAAVLTQVLFSVFASSGSLGLTVNKQSIKQGEDVNVTLSASTDTELSVAQARVTFDPAQLQFIGVTYTGSPLVADSPESSTGNGFVQVSRYTPPPFPSGNVYIATITFRALQSSGSAAVSIDQGSSVIYAASDASNILSGVSGTSVAMQATQVSQPSSPPPPSDNPSSAAIPAGGSTSSGGGSTGGSTSSGGTTDDGTGSPASLQSFATNATAKLQNPGSSQLGSQKSLISRVLSWVRAVLPYFLVLTVLAAVTYFGSKKLQHHSASVAVGGSSGTGFTPNSGAAGPGFGVLIGNDKENKKS